MLYESIEKTRKHLDAYRVHSNSQRPHRGRDMKRDTPANAFVRCRPKPRKTKDVEFRNAAESPTELRERHLPSGNRIRMIHAFEHQVMEVVPVGFDN